jgi:hypothetical protein
MLTIGAIIRGIDEHIERCSQVIIDQPTCDEGYVRTKNIDGSPSVKIDERREYRNIGYAENEINSTCEMNEVVSDCANPCQPSCIERNREPCSIFACSKGCVCKTGLIRLSNDLSSACVANDQCS